MPNIPLVVQVAGTNGYLNVRSGERVVVETLKKEQANKLQQTHFYYGLWNFI
jgi:hypothetical protein